MKLSSMQNVFIVVNFKIVRRCLNFLPIGSRPGGNCGNNRDFLAPGPPLGDILPGEYGPGEE